MSKKKKKDIKSGKNSDTQYAHNPNYCMIFPNHSDEDTVSTGQS